MSLDPSNPTQFEIAQNAYELAINAPPSPERDEMLRMAYAYLPLHWIYDHIDFRGGGLTPYQEEIIASIPLRKRVAVRGGHGLGKSSSAALLTLWFACTRSANKEDWKVVTTASAWRQLTKYLWPEIHKWAHRLDFDKLGRPPFNKRNELLALSLTLPYGEAFAVASSNSDYIEGAHADQMFYIFDESKAIPDSVFDAAEGALGGGGGREAFALASSTPGEPVGRFFDIHMNRDNKFKVWWTRHVKKEEVIEAGLVGRDWADQMKLQWGEDTALYMNKVEGEFKSGADDGLIPVEWVEAAFARWHNLNSDENGVNHFTNMQIDTLGIDVGHTGDETVVAMLSGDIVVSVRSWTKKDTAETTDLIQGILDKYKKTGIRAIIDVNGIGAGVFATLKKLRYNVLPFNASQSAKDYTDRSKVVGFGNTRAAALWNLREALDPAFGSEVALPPIDHNAWGAKVTQRNSKLLEDLVIPHWRDLGGRIYVEKKEEIQKRLGRREDGEMRSTDRGDAISMAFWARKMKRVVGPPAVGGSRPQMAITPRMGIYPALPQR